MVIFSTRKEYFLDKIYSSYILEKLIFYHTINNSTISNNHNSGLIIWSKMTQNISLYFLLQYFLSVCIENYEIFKTRVTHIHLDAFFYECGSTKKNISNFHKFPL